MCFGAEGGVLQYLRKSSGHFPSNEEGSPVNVTSNGGQIDVLPNLNSFLFGGGWLVIFPVEIFFGDYRFFVRDQILLVLVRELLTQSFVFTPRFGDEFWFLLFTEQATDHRYAARGIQYMQYPMIVLRIDLDGGVHARRGCAADQQRLFHAASFHFGGHMHHFIQ